MSEYAAIADAIIAKKPDFAEIRDDLIEQVGMFVDMAGTILEMIEDRRPQVKAALSLEPETPAELIKQIDEAFEIWGISLEKYGAFVGLTEPADCYTLVAMTLRQDQDTTVEREAMKTFIMSMAMPEKFDFLVDQAEEDDGSGD